MKPRTQALVLSLVLLAGSLAWFGSRPGAFAMFMPGPTVNLLGNSGKKPLLEITGHKTYRDKGELRLVTISTTRAEDRVGLIRALEGWIDPDVDVYPYRGIYQPTDTNKSTRQESVQQMTSSQDAAVGAALTELGTPFEQYVDIAGVAKDGPSAKVLKKGDRVVGVNDVKTTNLASVVDTIRQLKPGTSVTLTVLRGGERTSHEITTAPAAPTGPDAQKSRIGVTISTRFDFPYKVKLRLDEAIGGPSAGLMFALSIIDVLTPGSLTGGKSIAGTGEITVEGDVGPIGGVRQKIAGAEQDGAHLFLVPADNCAEALHADYDPAKIKLVRVATLEQAKGAIEAWVKDPKAELPTCKGKS